MLNRLKLLSITALLLVRSTLYPSENTSLLYKKGVDLIKEDKINDAIIVFSDIVNKSPYYCLGHYGLGKAYLYKKGMIKNAIRHLKFSTELDGKFVKGYFYLGIAYLLDRKYFNALKYFELAYRNDETFVEAVYNMGVVYDYIGKSYKAKVFYSRYMEIIKKKGEGRIF